MTLTSSCYEWFGETMKGKKNNSLLSSFLCLDLVPTGTQEEIFTSGLIHLGHRQEHSEPKHSLSHKKRDWKEKPPVLVLNLPGMFSCSTWAFSYVGSCSEGVIQITGRTTVKSVSKSGVNVML